MVTIQCFVLYSVKSITYDVCNLIGDIARLAYSGPYMYKIVSTDSVSPVTGDSHTSRTTSGGSPNGFLPSPCLGHSEQMASLVAHSWQSWLCKASSSSSSAYVLWQRNSDASYHCGVSLFIRWQFRLMHTFKTMYMCM